jgi:hypothetical protein
MNGKKAQPSDPDALKACETEWPILAVEDVLQVFNGRTLDPQPSNRWFALAVKEASNKSLHDRFMAEDDPQRMDSTQVAYRPSQVATGPCSGRHCKTGESHG